jgi:hypothetical protein
MKYSHNGYEADGHRLYRPERNHPSPTHWAHICRIALIRDGQACRTCWKSAKDGYSLECHHRHYDNWGNERPEDVVILCKRCQDLFMNDIRQARREFQETMFSPCATAPKDVFSSLYIRDKQEPSTSIPSSVFPARKKTRL